MEALNHAKLISGLRGVRHEVAETSMGTEIGDGISEGGSLQISSPGQRAGCAENLREGLPRGVVSARDRTARVLEGACPLAGHLLRMTLLFVVFLGCIYSLRTLVALMFPPGEYLGKLLELVDTYVALVGTIGYVAWMSIDTFFLMQERRGRRNPA